MNSLAGPPNRPYNYHNIDGVLVHKRWLNEDGTRKTGIELEREQLLVELELMADRLLTNPL